MTPAQIELLKRLIEADRSYHSRKAAGMDVHPDDRGVEVGWINAVDPRTAETLAKAGLAEITDGRYNINLKFIFLGSINPYDEVQKE